MAVSHLPGIYPAFTRHLPGIYSVLFSFSFAVAIRIILLLELVCVCVKEGVGERRLHSSLYITSALGRL